MENNTPREFTSRVSCALTLLVLTIFSAHGMAQTCPSAAIPHVQGTWKTLPYLAPINPISATLMHNGKILIVAGSENDKDNNSEGAESYRNAVWDPKGTTQASIAVQSIEYDVFCSGTAVLPDGRPLIVGGTSDYSFKGDNRASAFDPVTSQFAQSQSMVDGRWYATATTLGDGRIMAFSGIGLNGTNKTVEIYDVKNAGAGWTSPVTAPFSPPLYPHEFLLPSGKVFFTGQGGGRISKAWIFDPNAKTWTSSLPTTMDRTYGSAVLLPLLPPSYTPRVMNFGGGNPATNSTEIVDLSVSTPAWTPGPPMSTGRIEMNAVILPNGQVLAVGGSVHNESPDPAGKQADLYDSATNAFRPAGSQSYSRLYHSVAVLLPDATVVSMGSNPTERGGYEPAIEIYTPSYLYDANDRPIPTSNRPSITGLSQRTIRYNAPLSLTYKSTSNISAAVLMRPGSATHTIDMDQRLVGLCGPAPQPSCNGSNGTLNLTTPPNGNIAPPGYYMLFLLDTAGVPSQAQFIQLSPYPLAPPNGTISSPASDITTSAAGSVSFATTSTASKYSWVFPGGSPATSTAQNPGNITFSTPGTYVVSLTVIDASGNSDPSPSARTITVLPASADFSIAISPSSQTILPGGSAQFTVTVNSLNGFSSPVTLSVASESGFPGGITSGGFNPKSITGAGSSTLTMNTTTSANPYALSLTISGVSGTITHAAATTLVVNMAAPANLTANAGLTGTVSLSWSASIGATSYHLKRAQVRGGPYVAIACPTSTTFTDTGLVNGATYYYVVSAAYSAGLNAGGESPDSNEASAVPQPLPAAPTNVTASPGNLSGTISLLWTQSTGRGLARNNIYRRTATGSYSSTPTTQINATTGYLDHNLKSGVTYCYQVTVLKDAGESTKSVPEACSTAK